MWDYREMLLLMMMAALAAVGSNNDRFGGNGERAGGVGPKTIFTEDTFFIPLPLPNPTLFFSIFSNLFVSFLRSSCLETASFFLSIDCIHGENNTSRECSVQSGFEVEDMERPSVSSLGICFLL